MREEIDDIGEAFLISQLKKGTIKAFELVFRKYYEKLLLFSEGYVKDRDTAKDILQDVFLRFYDNRKNLPINTNFKSYLFTSVKNASLDYLKKLKIADKHNDLLKESILFSQSLDLKIDNELSNKINKAVDSLPNQCKKILKLKVIHGLKYQEISEDLDISINTVKKQISNAYSGLREFLDKDLNCILIILLLVNENL